VTRRNPVRHFVLVALLAIVAALPAAAEDVEKKFRIGATLGFFNAQDDVMSDAANTLTLVDRGLVFQDFFIDPRNDSATFGVLNLEPGASGTIYGQYAFTKIFILEASVGYSQQDIGDVELQVQFDAVQIPSFQPFLFEIHRFKVGEVERVPVKLTAIMRFRPRSSFNPYVGAGIGWVYNGFSVAPEFDALSVLLDGSRGGLATVSSATFGNPQLIRPNATAVVDLTGASVKVEDTFEAHLAFGIEYSFKRKWAAVLDARWTRSSRAVRVGFNDSIDLGVAVPERVDFTDSEFATTVYGGFHIPNGGLIDCGTLVPNFGVNPTHDCGADPSLCILDPTLFDGLPDPGIYYIQGGEFEYGGVSVEVGLRYTF